MISLINCYERQQMHENPIFILLGKWGLFLDQTAAGTKSNPPKCQCSLTPRNISFKMIVYTKSVQLTPCRSALFLISDRICPITLLGSDQWLSNVRSNVFCVWIVWLNKTGSIHNNINSSLRLYSSWDDICIIPTISFCRKITWFYKNWLS